LSIKDGWYGVFHVAPLFNQYLIICNMHECMKRFNNCSFKGKLLCLWTIATICYEPSTRLHVGNIARCLIIMSCTQTLGKICE
jgi:hypothetical protein